MINMLLDPLPAEYDGFPIDPDFQVGIQILQVLEDEELERRERLAEALSLLFPFEMPDLDTAMDGLMWFLYGWNHDRRGKQTEREKVLDYDIDHFRIYAAFRQQYGINLNDLGKRCTGYRIEGKQIIPEYEDNHLHFWEFMALLSTLEECAHTRVIDIRTKKFDKGTSAKERKLYTELKEIYSLRREARREYTEEESLAIDAFDRMKEEQRLAAR